MKITVYDQDFQEPEIKPKASLDQYCKLMDREVSLTLASPERLISRECPGCHSQQRRPAFDKSGLSYVECAHCKSVYVSPCPSDDALTAFYRDSAAATFWRVRLWEETREVRRQKLYRPLAEWILNTVDRYLPNANRAIDVGYHSKLLLEELMLGSKPLSSIVVTNAIADIECSGIEVAGVQICPTVLTELKRYVPVDIVFAFDILPCIADVDAVFSGAQSGLTIGGLLFVNTISISGFDLRVLWEHSPIIYPPDRLNLLSVEGLENLSKRHGFEILEFSTPGTFDVEIVKRTLQRKPELTCDRFIRYLLMERDDQALRKFQEYLQEHRLSSYVRLVLRKC